MNNKSSYINLCSSILDITNVNRLLIFLFICSVYRSPYKLRIFVMDWAPRMGHYIAQKVRFCHYYFVRFMSNMDDTPNMIVYACAWKSAEVVQCDARPDGRCGEMIRCDVSNSRYIVMTIIFKWYWGNRCYLCSV